MADNHFNTIRRLHRNNTKIITKYKSLLTSETIIIEEQEWENGSVYLNILTSVNDKKLYV